MSLVIRSFYVCAFTLAATFAQAAQIDPRCTNVKDKIGCTCAVQNGGDIGVGRDGRKRWFSVRGSTNNNKATNEAFIRCSILHKGRRG